MNWAILLFDWDVTHKKPFGKVDFHSQETSLFVSCRKICDRAELNLIWRRKLFCSVDRIDEKKRKWIIIDLGVRTMSIVLMSPTNNEWSTEILLLSKKRSEEREFFPFARCQKTSNRRSFLDGRNWWRRKVHDEQNRQIERREKKIRLNLATN